MRIDPIAFEVFENLFVSVAEEMGVTLCRTSFSPN
ncbi:MAG: hydantoinase B/oxoprolinase family protein, partial [Vicinamibacteria bacterium]